MMHQKAMFVGRWQPLHHGHEWLINQKLKQHIPVLICVRDTPVDKDNPFTTEQTIEMLEMVYENEDVEIMIIPDIESVNWGRDVGYETNEFKPPEHIDSMSATQFRASIRNKDSAWKEHVSPLLHEPILEYLKNNGNLR